MYVHHKHEDTILKNIKNKNIILRFFYTRNKQVLYFFQKLKHYKTYILYTEQKIKFNKNKNIKNK